MIIAIDFDGTIVRGEYPSIEGLQPYAKYNINKLYEEGHYIIIWTCRTGEHLLDAINYLIEQGVRFHRVNDHSPDNVAKYGDGGKKIYADVYIDDKQVDGLPPWSDIYEYCRKIGFNVQIPTEFDTKN
ncbi:MAG: hypothetical protein ACRCZB_03555 [Bacteroidales bacterium]